MRSGKYDVGLEEAYLSDSGSELSKSRTVRFIVGWRSDGLISHRGRKTKALSWSRRCGICEVHQSDQNGKKVADINI